MEATMEYRQLGESDLKVTPIALGTWAIGGWMWGGTDDDDAIDGIRRALDLGMTTVDTAPIYGFGHSEHLCGRALEGRRDDVQLLTKFGLRWDLEKGVRHFETRDNEGRLQTVYKFGGAKGVIEECERSLRRLGTDDIDLYQHHWPDASTPIEETMDACAKLLKQGKVRAVGVSNYTPEMMDEAREVVPLASNQPPYSMLKRDIEADVLPYCREHNVGVLVYGPLQSGLLTGKVTEDREFPEGDKRRRSKLFTRENRRRVLEFLEGLRPIAETHDATFAQLTLAWTAGRPGVTSALVGVRNPKQAEENAAAANVKLTDEEMSEIDARLDDLELEA
jgi:aryl-alcohol dehydrogenase-like predicted oxidoreductase